MSREDNERIERKIRLSFVMLSNGIRCSMWKKFFVFLPSSVRCLSISKSDLVESSRRLNEYLRTIDQLERKNPLIDGLSHSIGEVHQTFPSATVASSTKEIYQKNASLWNSRFLQLETERKNFTGQFRKENLQEYLLLLLRYNRYLRLAFIYRLITFNIQPTIEQLATEILQLTEDRHLLNEKSVELIGELAYFVYSFSSDQNLHRVKSSLSRTNIVSTLSSSLEKILTDDHSFVLVNQLCLALRSIAHVPPSSSISQCSENLLDYLHRHKSSSLPILDYLVLIQQSSSQHHSNKYLSLLNNYLLEISLHQRDLHLLLQLLILTHSAHYSHQLFIRKVTDKIDQHLKKTASQGRWSIDVKLYSRLISLLCLTDPSNRCESRSTVVRLAERLADDLTESEEMKSPQWLVQAQHGMMMVNIYHYPLLTGTVQQRFLPFLFQYLGIYSSSLQRQLFDLHHTLLVDRPEVRSPLLNSQVLSFVTKVSKEYRSSIRAKQNSYQQLLNEIQTSFNQIYGPKTAQTINTDDRYPSVLFDFLQVNLPMRDDLQSIGINCQQRIAVLPIFNSMLIRHQRSDGSLVRILSAPTTLRYRLIAKDDYQVLLIFQGEYLRARRENRLQSFLETKLALRSLPEDFSSSVSADD